MGIQKGIDCVIEYNAGTDGAPSWVQVGFQTTGSYKGGAAAIDTTTKSGDGWEENTPGLSNFSFAFEGKMDRSDPGLVYLENAHDNATQVHLRWRFKTGSQGSRTGKGTLESFEYSFAHDGAATFSGSMKGTGKPVKA